MCTIRWRSAGTGLEAIKSPSHTTSSTAHGRRANVSVPRVKQSQIRVTSATAHNIVMRRPIVTACGAQAATRHVHPAARKPSAHQQAGVAVASGPVRYCCAGAGLVEATACAATARAGCAVVGTASAAPPEAGTPSACGHRHVRGHASAATAPRRAPSDARPLPRVPPEAYQALQGGTCDPACGFWIRLRSK